MIMGIVNVTPDSFSDGGKYFSLESSYKHSIKLLHEGADILDIGGESSRPGARPISVEDELERILPIIKKINRYTKPVEKLPIERIVIPIAIVIPIIPNKFPLLEVSGDERPLNARINKTPEIR